MPAMWLRRNTAHHGTCPAPMVPKVNLPGRERASAMNSFRSFAGSVELAINANGEVSMSDTGVKSFSTS